MLSAKDIINISDEIFLNSKYFNVFLNAEKNIKKEFFIENFVLENVTEELEILLSFFLL